jgi:hypothetical protein
MKTGGGYKGRLAGGLVIAGLALGAGSPVRPASAAEAPAPPATVQLAAVALPIVINGRLLNYVFVTIKLDLAAGVDGAAVRAKEPFFRDALVRAGHRAPFILTTDYMHIDAARVRAEVMNDAVGIVGRGVVRNVEITKQASQRILRAPSGASANRGPELIP